MRPLLDDASGDPSAVTRDYLLESNTEAAPLLSVWGGKITTFRKLAEEAADEVGRMLGEAAQRVDRARASWPAATSRPGSARHSGPTPTSIASWCEARKRYPWMAESAVAAPGARLRQPHRSSPRRHRWPTWAPRSRRACTRPSSTTCSERVGVQRRRRAVAAQQAGPALHGAAARRSRELDGAQGNPHEKGSVMQLALDGISKKVGAEDWLYEMSLAPAPARGHRAARRHAGRQDQPDADHGGPGQAQPRPGAGRRPRRDRRAGARAQRGHGLPAVHQLPLAQGGGQHRLAAEAARREEHRAARA